jgi:hypothetical protein
MFFRTRNGHGRLYIKLAENAIEWLQHHISLSAYNTLLQHGRQARLAQPLAKNGEKEGTKPLDRVTTNTTCTSMTKAPRSPGPTNHNSCA